MRAERMQQAMLAIASNQGSMARHILRDLILDNPRDEEAWLLMAEAVEQRDQVIDCLESVLRINPENKQARDRLEALRVESEPRPECKSIEAVSTQQVIRAPKPYELQKNDQTATQGRPRRAPNWPLIVGGILVALTLTLAIFGPSLAKHDPLQMSTIYRVGEKYLTPPYPPGTPGYPLGSDGNGRDLVSRMLWGLGPTLTMVLIVASIRLVLGTLIGLTAGWSTGRTGHLLDSVITAGLSIPVIIVALGGIAAVGVDLGIWAFIIGLCITGWVETARLVREQTRAARGQVYVEAAQALGASNISILLRHVLQQILSLLWMLFAFEVSATLMLTAALGFLGYYIGGDVWVAVSDATAEAVSGAPELGQMLAASGVSLTKPWGLLVIGALVFIIVLGFNLLGEGLRKQNSLYSKTGSTRWVRLMADMRFWLDEHIAWPLSNLPRAPAFRPAMMVLMVAILVGGIYWGYDHFIASESSQPEDTNLQVEHLWSSARRDPFGTRWVQAAGPQSPEVNWTFKDDSGFSGGPAVAKDGTVYITSRAGLLYALNPEGKILWQVLLPETPVGTPALSESGEIYISDERGGLSAISADGKLQWHYADQSSRPATTGPVVAANGNIYYGMQGAIMALDPLGDLLWEAHPTSPNTAPSKMVQVSPDDELLFWGDVILNAADGSNLEPANLEQPDQYFIGADGSIYQIEGHEITQWNGDGLEASSGKELTWDYSKFTVARMPEDVGAAPDGVVWLFYTGFARGYDFGEDTRMVWLDEDSELLGNAFHPMRNSQVIGVDENHTLYTCGNLEQGYGDPQCGAFSPDSEEALWMLNLEGSQEVAGGALIPGRLYIASLEGSLVAIGLNEAISISVQAIAVPTEHSSSTTDAGDKPTPAERGILDQAGEPIGPTQGDTALLFEYPQGFSGGPAVAEDGTIYILSSSGSLLALNPQGQINWEVRLPVRPVGTPAIGPEGSIYLSDIEGSLSAYLPSGEIIWRFMPEGDFKATSGPVIGADGTLYYTVVANSGKIQAVSPAGKGLWLADLETTLFYNTPEVSPGGEYIFFRNEVFDRATGEALYFNLDFKIDQFFGGEDGRNYLRAGGTVVEWKAIGTNLSLAEERVLVDDEHMGTPNFANVTPEGVVWLQSNYYIMWFSKDGESLGISSPDGSFLMHPVAIDRDFTVYTCGRKPVDLRLNIKPYCFALSPDAEQPTWEVKLADEWENFSGSAIVAGKIYVATEEGHLYEIRGEP